MSVRAVEDEARRHNQQAAAASPPPQGPGRRLRPPGLLELEDLLSTHLDTRVKVEMGANRGRVVVDFATLEDLERIYRAMTGKVPVS
jgi:ParB family chromosome partitioning protein